MDDTTREELLDLLFDLQHDLGKYLRQPLAMLAADAPPDEVRAAVARALRETRRGAGGVRAARDIWNAFVAEEADRLAALPGRADLASAVQEALAWDEALYADAPLDRRAVEASFAAVSRHIRQLQEELSHAR